jgi:two-component system chemotaxis response regulator CheB
MERERQQVKHVVAIGASAGGLDALRHLVRLLPADFPAPILVVVHTAPQSPGVLDAGLSRWGPLPAVRPRDGARLEPRRIYVAPPDFHLLVEPGRVRVTRGPRENRFRPAIDPLFRSAAQVFGPAAIGVVLSGNLDDGAAGLRAIKQLGGVAIVQDPDEAMFPSMPLSALASADVDHVLPAAAIPPLLARLTSRVEVAEDRSAPEALDVEVRIAKEEDR